MSYPQKIATYKWQIAALMFLPETGSEHYAQEQAYFYPKEELLHPEALFRFINTLK